MKVGDMVLKKSAMKWYKGMFGIITGIPSENSSCVTWSNGETFLYLNQQIVLVGKSK
tara:strand:- start:411 stop:581 length:171 start_codon:yes stop_codon:yes gene_type:complete